ncbi:MAG: hypothetical protein JNL83_10880 [Myxococcales bacterium]|nr:hypothetical protein [Myxococcales bacterium]
MKHALLVAIAACAPEVPAEPSFQLDVMPILAANCVRCHGYPTIGGAPASFRLDTFGDVVLRPGIPSEREPCGAPDDPDAAHVLCGAASLAVFSARRSADQLYPMPPRFPLDSFQIETLERWAEAPNRGAPRRGNHAPDLVLENIAEASGSVVVRLRVDDLDGDMVGGTLRAVGGGSSILVGVLRSGAQALHWDTTGVPAGDYVLRATLDDGAEPIDVDLGALTTGAGS